ncbi:Tetratricopeptide repeat protein [Musa troglodytarum]|uniref:ER membrane protein complex subunit 2 n=1 Tax=Musa troglodytarum TaxID=320322 RepID=A0A9E7E928_9LILI|nr:Tetratricopeptide repeat protein [Musa troglodytarum]
MVGASEAARMERLESQVENGGGGAWEYLCLVRKLKARRSDKVLKHGLSILNDHRARSSLGAEEWTLYEQVAFAAMDCQQYDVAKDCIAVLSKQFPGSIRIGRIEGMLLESKGAWAEAEKVYARLLDDSPLNQVLYTIGGLENLQTAKKYYASTIALTGGKNTRALYGISLISVVRRL